MAVPDFTCGAAYRKGDVAGAGRVSAGGERPRRAAGSQWAALRIDPHPSAAALAAFARPTRNGRATAMSATGRKPSFSPIRPPRGDCCIFLPNSRRSRARARSRSRAPMPRSAMSTKRSPRSARYGERQFRRVDGKPDPARIRRVAVEGGPQDSRRPASLRRELFGRRCERRRLPARCDGARSGAYRRGTGPH